MKAPKGGNGLVFSKGSIACCRIYDSYSPQSVLKGCPLEEDTSCGVN